MGSQLAFTRTTHVTNIDMGSQLKNLLGLKSENFRWNKD